MQIIIKRMNGSTTTISMNPSDTIHSVKTKVYDVLGIPPREQRFMFAGVQLTNDDRTLSSYGSIKEGSILHLVQRTRSNESNPNTISIKAARAAIEEIDPSDCIRYIKTKINEALGYSIDAQRLLFGSVELKDGYTVSDYNIKDGDEVVVEGQVDIIFKDEDTGEEQLVTTDLDKAFATVYSEYCQNKSINMSHYHFNVNSKARSHDRGKLYARKSSVGSTGFEKLEISVKKVAKIGIKVKDEHGRIHGYHVKSGAMICVIMREFSKSTCIPLNELWLTLDNGEEILTDSNDTIQTLGIEDGSTLYVARKTIGTDLTKGSIEMMYGMKGTEEHPPFKPHLQIMDVIDYHEDHWKVSIDKTLFHSSIQHTYAHLHQFFSSLCYQMGHTASMAIVILN